MPSPFDTKEQEIAALREEARYNGEAACAALSALAPFAGRECDCYGLTIRCEYCRAGEVLEKYGDV